MELYNIKNTKNDRPISHRDWIDVLDEYLKMHNGIGISNKHSKQGAHMSDHPYDDFEIGNVFNHKWYIVSVSKSGPNDTNNIDDNTTPIEINHNDYASYEILKKF